MVGAERFELPTPWSQTRCATSLRYAPMSCYSHKAISLTLLALAKAFCVAYFYMHLNEETRWLKFIAAIPIAAFVYFIVVVLESLYR